MTRMLLALSLTVGALGLSGAAEAQGRNCAPRQVVVDRLAEGFSETRQSIGMGTNSAIVETFANLDTGTWTITVTLPSGVTCLVASGQAFERLEEALQPAGIRL